MRFVRSPYFKAGLAGAGALLVVAAQYFPDSQYVQAAIVIASVLGVYHAPYVAKDPKA